MLKAVPGKRSRKPSTDEQKKMGCEEAFQLAKRLFTAVGNSATLY